VEVIFAAEKIISQPEKLMLRILNKEEDVEAFFKKLRDWEVAQDGEVKQIQVRLQVYRKTRSINQNNLQWEICRRIAAAQGESTAEMIHEGIKEVAYPRRLEATTGIWIPKDGKEMTTVEYSQVIEYCLALSQGLDDPPDLADIWILFTDWRFGQEVDPLEGTYDSHDQYKEKHPLCEACGAWLGEGGDIDHIFRRGRDERGEDEDFNWWHLCRADHAIKHAGAMEAFVRRYRHLKIKAERSYVRHGAILGKETE
jgi:hypothetical protein